jgi:pyrroline-5-carboxylate reductase
MAEAIIGGILQSEAACAGDVVACDTSPERRDLMRTQYGVAVTDSAAEAVGRSEVLILAVKPQQMEALLEQVAPLLSADHLLISIAAGRALGYLRRLCGAAPRLARVMPNLPLMVGEGMSAFCLEDDAAHSDRETVSRIFGGAGAVLEIAEERFDAVTALSGSGPAFTAYLLKAMIDAAVQLGIAEETARLMAEQTMIGTAIYLQESGGDIAAFIRAVCSPGGTTEAGMKVLEASDTAQTLERTLAAAAARSRELG